MRAKKGHLLQTENLVRSKKWRQLPVPGNFERLTYCLLVGAVDSWGMMPADPFTLKAELDPIAGTHEPGDYVEAVQILTGVKLLQFWTHQGDPWLRVIGHDKIQKDGIRRRSATPAVPIPDLPLNKSRSSPGVVRDNSQSSPGPGVIQSSPELNSNEVEVEVELEGELEEEASEHDLLDRYKNKDLIEKTLTAIASTRKSNKISDSVRQGILQKWNGCSVEAVMAGCRTYLEKDYAAGEKRENYLWAIIKERERGAASTAVNTVELDPEVVDALNHLRRAHAKAGGYELHGEVRLDTNAGRIAEVLAKCGREYCEVVQTGHIRMPDKAGKFRAWVHAYPAAEGNRAEPDWDWIEQYHRTGMEPEKKEIEYQPGYGPP